MQLPEPLRNNTNHLRLERLIAERSRLQECQLSETTVRGYAHDFKLFRAWCDRMGLAELPANPETITLYLTDLLTQGKRVATAARIAAAVAYHHRRRNLDNPCNEQVRALIAGARRLRAEQPRQMEPITLAQLRAIMAALARDATAKSARDLAIVLVGFASALRRSNLSWLMMQDVTFCSRGLRIQVRREKQDRRGEGRAIAIPHAKDANLCPIRALNGWLDHRGKERGPLFTRLDNGRRGDLLPLTPAAITIIVQKAIRRLEVEATDVGAHSLRAGFITEAGLAGVSHLVIAQQSGHRSLDSLKRYFRPLDLWRANAAAMLDL